MVRYILSAGFVALFFSGQAMSQSWNPKPSWKDSYSVDGTCYCDSNGFDHGADQLTYDTPAGELSIPQICADITAVLGVGSTQGRIPYNDVQCGNGPANDAGDEDHDACPGRVDIGPSGCQIIGPKWDLDAVYSGSPSNSNPTSGVMSASASRNSQDASLAIDGNLNTRWTTRQTQRSGQVFELDLGEIQTVGQVVLDTQNSPNDDPASYNLAVSVDGNSFQVVATGSGTGGTTNISFASQSVRYIRITQTGSKNKYWWSIHELQVGASGSSGSTGGNENTPLDRSNWVMYSSNNSRDAHKAVDNNDGSRWTTRQRQRDGQYFEIDLQSTESFSRIVLDSSASASDYPRGYRVRVSNNGNNWNTVASGNGNNAVTMLDFFQQSARYIRIEQTGTSDKYWWSIHEVSIYQ